MPVSDTAWLELPADQSPGNGSYAVIATTSLAQSPLGYSSSIFRIVVDDPTTANELLLRVEGTMESSPSGDGDWDVIPAAILDDAANQYDLTEGVFDASAFLNAGDSFRLRVDEQWKLIRVLAQADVGDVDIDPAFRRIA